MITGSAGEAGTLEVTTTLAHCDRPLGMVSIMEPSSDAMLVLTKELNLESPIPLLRLMMAQSNCFQVVDLQAVSDPSTAAKVHYMIRPNIIFSDQTGGLGALPQPLQEVLEPGQPLSLRGLQPLAHQALQRGAEVAVGEHIVRHLLQHGVGIELRQVLRSIPARVADEHRLSPDSGRARTGGPCSACD